MAKINSYSNAIIELTDKMKTLELENNKLKKPITKTKKSSTDNVTDYN